MMSQEAPSVLSLEEQKSIETVKAGAQECQQTPWKVLLSFFAHVAGHALFMLFWKEAFLEGCGPM